MKQEMKEIKEEDLLEEVKEFSIASDAFSGPLLCTSCDQSMSKVKIDVKLPDQSLTLHVDAWRCSKCGKEYLSGEQAKKMDLLLEVNKLLGNNTQTFNQTLSYDGRNFFIPFPAEVTKSWGEGIQGEIKALSATDFFVHVYKAE